MLDSQLKYITLDILFLAHVNPFVLSPLIITMQRILYNLREVKAAFREITSKPIGTLNKTG